MEIQQQLLFFFVYIPFGFSLIWYFCSQLTNGHDGDVRVIWYFFSLTIVVSLLIGLWAVSYGSIDGEGNFQGDSGGFLFKLISGSLDVNLSLLIVICIFAVLILPQLLSYVLSGIFGVASTIAFFSESYSFVVWWIAKTFIVASGVMLVVPVFAMVHSWDEFTLNVICFWFMLSIYLCLASFMLLFFYRKGYEFLNKVINKTPECIVKKLSRIHKSFTRNIYSHTGDDSA